MQTFCCVNADSNDTVEPLYDSDMPGNVQLALQCSNGSHDNMASVESRS